VILTVFLWGGDCSKCTLLKFGQTCNRAAKMCCCGPHIWPVSFFYRQMAACLCNKFLQPKKTGAWTPRAKCKIQSIVTRKTIILSIWYQKFPYLFSRFLKKASHVHFGLSFLLYLRWYQAFFLAVVWESSKLLKTQFYELEQGFFFGVFEKNSSKIKLKLKEFFEKTQGFSRKTQGWRHCY